MSKIKKKNISVWAMISKILPQIFSVSPRLFIINYTFFALNGAAFAASTLCMQILFDKVTDFTMNRGTFKGAVLAFLLISFFPPYIKYSIL